MADNRYGDERRRDSWRGRDSSIFSDDEGRSPGSSRAMGGYSRDHGRGRGGWSGRGDDQRGWSERRREESGWGRGHDDERGFFERAGDEVRSWFGDEEAERRRERDMRSGRDGAFGSRDNGGRAEWGRSGPSERSSYGAFGTSDEYGRGGAQFISGSGFDRDWGQGDFGQSGFGSGRSGGRSQWDDNYRRWREQQIAQLDRDYEEYCRDCQDQFEQDFGSWRSSRLTQGGTGTDMSGGSSSSSTFQSGGRSTAIGADSGRNQDSAGAAAGSVHTEIAGATTAAGGTASASDSSTGSSGGRSSRSRS